MPLTHAISWLFDPSRLLLIALVLSRVGGLVMIAPIFGASEAPLRLRALFAILLTLLIVPVQFHLPVPETATLLGFASYVAVELGIGLVLGLGVWIYLQAFQLAGHIISQASGLSLADAFAPGLDTNVPVVSQLLHMFALALFVAIGGHRLVVEGFLQTFAAIPPGQGAWSPEVPQLLTTMLSQSFQLGVRIAAPGLTALLLATLVLGLISRTLPQLNVMALGFGLNAMLTLSVTAFSLGAAAWAFEDQLDAVVTQIVNGLAAGER
jgi:flagellar biosynthetic protein FliR